MKEAFANCFRGKEYFGHPSGLFVLFFTEMWERFSYYGMRALLVLYMTKYLLADPAVTAEVFGFNYLLSILNSVFGELNTQQISSQIYGIYTGLVYFTPFFGGILADKVLGQYRTVYVGGILMTIGHFLMAFDKFFLLALLCIILGNGAFKPNISTQVGNLYKEGDNRRDGAFTIFYMGINLGAFLAPFVCGTLGQTVGWHWGFGAAGVGMILGLIVYWLGSELVPKHTTNIAQNKAEKRPLTSQEWKSVWALLLLCGLNIAFWAIFEQQGNVLQLWADDRTNWMLLGFEIPSTWYQSFNPAFIFIFAPLVTQMWAKQNKKGKEPSSVAKMGIGCFLCGAAYIVMIVAALVVPENERGSVFWLTMTTWMFTMGELYLSPIGLSLVTKVAPRPIVSMMMGAWFMSSFFGNYLTGYIGSFYSVMEKNEFFALLAGLGMGTGLIFFVLKKPLKAVIGKSV
ncbi:MAG: peptide MFS transporter [Bdellovibrionales bacterium]|nr:peptide MFS transporter [Bdellovibrionales bacterium]